MEYTHVILFPRGCQSWDDAQKVPSTWGDKQPPRALFLWGSCLKCSANELPELYRFFSQGGKESQGNRTTCQTRADLRVLTQGTAVSPRGLHRNRVFLRTGGCCADTQSRTPSYPRVQGLPATQPLPKRLMSRPSLSSDKQLLRRLPRSESSARRCQAETQLRTKMYFLLDLREKQKVPESCSVAEGKNATKKTITVSFLSTARACTGKGRTPIPAVSRSLRPGARSFWRSRSSLATVPGFRTRFWPPPNEGC